jgi:hypothetical protein
MQTTKRFIVLLLCLLLPAPLLRAQPLQGKQHDTQTRNTSAQDVLIVIQQDQVRFSAQRAVA